MNFSDLILSSFFIYFTLQFILVLSQVFDFCLQPSALILSSEKKRKNPKGHTTIPYNLTVKSIKMQNIKPILSHKTWL